MVQTANPRASRESTGVMISKKAVHSAAKVDHVNVRSMPSGKCSRIHTPAPVTSLS